MRNINLEKIGDVRFDQERILLKTPGGQTHEWLWYFLPDAGQNLPSAKDARSELLHKVICGLILRGLADLSHPVILMHIKTNQELIREQRLALRTLELPAEVEKANEI